MAAAAAGTYSGEDAKLAITDSQKRFLEWFQGMRKRGVLQNLDIPALSIMEWVYIYQHFKK